MALLEGFAVSGEVVARLEDKSATIVKVPHYISVPDPDREGEEKRKLVLAIKLSDGSEMEYYPNKTSWQEMGKKWGVNLDNWLNKKFEFEIIAQKVRGESKQVLYAKIK